MPIEWSELMVSYVTIVSMARVLHSEASVMLKIINCMTLIPAKYTQARWHVGEYPLLASNNKGENKETRQTSKTAEAMPQ